MATLVCEAIEIITDTGLGVPVSYSNTAIGLASDGHFYLITDRPTISVVTGDTSQTTWYTGILTRDYGNWTLSRNIDFVEAGAFESVSDFNVGIKNTSDFRNTLQSNGVYLGRRRVKYYRATSTNGTTWNFELRWTGIIDDQPFNERAFSLRCVSVAKDIFGSLPTSPVNDSTFPGAPKDSRDKMVPIAIGRVGYSPLTAISEPGEKVVLVRTTLGSELLEYTACGLRDYNSTAHTVNLYTKGKTFQQNDSRLKDCMLTVISGGGTQSIPILSNLATDGSENTNITLSEPFAGTFVGWSSGTTETTVWFAEVQKITATLLASTRPVAEVQENVFGRPALSTWDTDAKRYQDVSDISRVSDASNVKSTGFPGVDILAQALDSDGEASAYFKIKCEDIQYRDSANCTWSGPSSGSQPNLFDGDQGTGYQVTNTTTGGFVQLDLTIPRSVMDQGFSDLYLLVDAKFHLTSGSSGGHSFSYKMYGQDVYGQVTTQIGTEVVPMLSATLTTAYTEKFSLHGSYYNSETSPDLFYTLKDDAAMTGLLDDLKKFRAFPRVMIHMSFSSASSAYVADVLEIAFVGRRAVSVVDSTVYGSLQGEVYGNTMDGRVGATDYPASVSRALEYLIRNYDENAPAWQASHAYLAGEQVRGTADTGHVFVCTVAGTSSATEPTWTDTTAATYTDGTVTWKEHHDIPIDTTSFDNAHVNRGLWLVGRTLTEKKKSLDYYQTLLAQSFLLGTMTPAGKVQINAWLQRNTPLFAFSESNILQGSLSDVNLTPVRRMYNDIRVKYDKNPGSGTFNKQIAITNIDKPAFPGPFEPAIIGTSLGAFSATNYVDFGVQGIQIATTLPHGLQTGDYASLSGNTHGYDFTALQVYVITDYIFQVIVSGYVFLASPSTNGTLVADASWRRKWKDYVTGIDNYSTAKDLWEQCHNSYLVTQAVNPLPDDLGSCEWFFDPYATDPNGNLLWPDLNVGDSHAAVGFVEGLANWTAWQKKQVTFETADNAAFSALGLGNCVSFTDSKLTSGSTLTGWIHEKTQLPRTDKLPERFRWGVTLYPEALSVYTPPFDIEEHGATDIYDEHGATDIIEEHGA